MKEAGYRPAVSVSPRIRLLAELEHVEAEFLSTGSSTCRAPPGANSRAHAHRGPAPELPLFIDLQLPLQLGTRPSTGGSDWGPASS